MPNLFINTDLHTAGQAQLYISLLKAAGGLSKLFSEGNTPYLHYRLAENLFCHSFDADNKARSDISADAKLNVLGFGLKTFVIGDIGKDKFEKIAEFNRDSELIKPLGDRQAATTISELRNYRIDLTRRILSVDQIIYHCVCRAPNMMSLHESPMDLIDIANITDVRDTNQSIHFSDGQHDYRYSKSKSTLYRRFRSNEPIFAFDVDILQSPIDILKSFFETEVQADFFAPQPALPEIILPLYSYQYKVVKPKSGLNEWAAKGRPRHIDEVYIPIPSIIHEYFPGFLPGPEDTFTLHIPNGGQMTAKVCQAGNKALMSNPNKDLGKWILRDVLQLPPETLVTTSHLRKMGIDSVRITKVDNENFSIDFAEYGTFEEFARKLLIEN